VLVEGVGPDCRGLDELVPEVALVLVDAAGALLDGPSDAVVAEPPETVPVEEDAPAVPDRI